MRLVRLTILLLLASCATEEMNSEALREHTRGMNVLLVVMDTANARHFSYMGYHRETTPNIDRLAAESIVFTDVYAQASATPLSMYSMMTSRYPILEEEQYPATGELAAIITSAMPTLATWASEKFPTRAAFLGSSWMREELGFHYGWSTFNKVYDRVPPTSTVPANLVTDEFTRWIGQTPAEPWLSWIHYLEPHTPYTPPEPWFSMFDPEVRGLTDGTSASLREWREKTPGDAFIKNTVALYDGNLAWVDSEFQRVVESLKERGVWDQTIVVITSDHGEAFWEHGVRGHGTHIYEEFVRVPLVIRVPGLSPRRIGGSVELVDLVPTLLDLAGVFVPQGSTAGQSLVECMTGEREPSELAFFRNHKLGYLELGVRRDRLKYHYYFGRHIPELFDLGSDPGELSNMVPDELPAPPAIGTLMIGMQELIDQLIQGKSGTGDDFDPSFAGADSLDADTIEALRAIGYFGN